ncbi:5'/3'-nucleotidase SurE [Terasakiispira papahanaumokuakeensis]|uniref:5'-nucleotidase SurE n=1 Tax=Terasakiispira papahanaumokuakeensis TaxID=197479 RepID=A0A1E2VB70_9GAMM|nr:5'/3'-nucleotidase SurE [Terasakiispira papahanaumokuakeensis]ODC04260.1 5'/3'-nucleotidase SurE [Terasakiispira papahanaumokuakeensis]
MKLLLSNDDGVNAPGLAALASSLQSLGECCVVAPDRNRSGASNSLSLERPLKPQQTHHGFWSIDGTPTDCVHLALGGLFNFEPDMVVSGINAGANLGDDVLYSGTVAAAMEGRFLGKPALAISLAGHEHYETAAQVAYRLVSQYDRLSGELALPPRTLLNVNVPNRPYAQIQGFKVTRLGHRGQASAPVTVKDPRGQTRYWIAGVGKIAEAGPGTDFDAIAQGFVSITPLHIDMTRHDSLEQVSAWLDLLN